MLNIVYIINLNSNNDNHVLLVGDFNAHIGTESYLIENNDFVNNCDKVLSEFPETDFLINTPNSADSLERLNLLSFRIFWTNFNHRQE